MLRPVHACVLTLGFGAALGACFDAPQAPVQFSCDPIDAPQCPPGYTCEADGCCHRNGSDFAAHEGECQLAGAIPTGGPPGTSTMGSSTAGTSEDDGTTSGSSSSSGSSGSSSSSTDSSSGTNAGSTDDSGSTAGSTSATGSTSSSSSG